MELKKVVIDLSLIFLIVTTISEFWNEYHNVSGFNLSRIFYWIVVSSIGIKLRISKK